MILSRGNVKSSKYFKLYPMSVWSRLYKTRLMWFKSMLIHYDNNWIKEFHIYTINRIETILSFIGICLF